jgi:hypothetical protein
LLLALLVVPDVNLGKYAVHWAAQIGCPSSLVPYLLAPLHTPKSSLLDDAKLAFQIKTQNRLRLFCDHSGGLLVLTAL